MYTIYTILGAIVFWFAILWVLLSVAGIALEMIWEKYFPGNGLFQMKIYNKGRQAFLRWKETKLLEKAFQ